MGIGVDAHEAAERQGWLRPTPIKIEPPGVCADLDNDAMLGTCCKHLLNVDLIAGTPQQLRPVRCQGWSSSFIILIPLDSGFVVRSSVVQHTELVVQSAGAHGEGRVVTRGPRAQTVWPFWRSLAGTSATSAQFWLRRALLPPPGGRLVPRRAAALRGTFLDLLIRFRPVMPRDKSLTLADIRSPTLSIVCQLCGRRGYVVAKLIDRHEEKLTHLLLTLADCPKSQSTSMHDECKVVYEGLTIHEVLLVR
jgi:hypothetical protein